MAILGNEAVLTNSADSRISWYVSPRILAVTLLALALLALPLDLPLARACLDGDLPGDLARVVYLSEIFAHGAGVFVLLMTAFVLDVGNRRRLLRVGLCALCGGVFANGVKMLVARTRPDDFNLDGSILASFQGWLPILGMNAVEEWDRSMQGFPSAHAATAVGFALGLAAVYPRGRYLFFGFAALASFQRIVSGSHFLSDVFVGAAVGCLAAAFMRQGSFLGRFLDAWEARIPASSAPSVGGPAYHSSTRPAVSTLLSHNE